MLLQEITKPAEIHLTSEYERGRALFAEYKELSRHLDTDIKVELKNLFNDLISVVKTYDQPKARKIIKIIEHLMYDSHPKEQKFMKLRSHYSSLIRH